LPEPARQLKPVLELVKMVCLLYVLVLKHLLEHARMHVLVEKLA
jgi:hypothetical protein